MYEMSIMKPGIRRFIVPVARTFKGSGWFGWIRKWIWDRWSEPYFQEETFGTRVVVRDAEIASTIHKAVVGLGLDRSEIEMIVIGPERFNELRRDVHIAAFELPLDGKLRFMGIPVRVVPWFEGMLVIPKA
jgi:hypothetical protein